MKKLFFCLICFVSLLFFSSFCVAVPNLISYQGVLNDASGNPVNNTSLEMTFAIYDVETGGSAFWSESQSVRVSNGVFNVKLGTVQELSTTLFRNESLWLGIKVGSDVEMAPRQRITSAPYAHKSEILTEGFVPVGSVITWIKDDPLVITGNVTGGTSNVLIDDGAMFNGNLGGKPIQISYPTLFYDCPTVYLSDDPNYGIFVTSTSNRLNISYDPPGAFYEQTFFYTDGTSAPVTVSSHTSGSYIWKGFNNPYIGKAVWKIQKTASDRAGCGGLKINIVPGQNFENIINAVNSQTQITLSDNMAVSTQCTYTIWPTPGLPFGWVEMNGQTIDDPESVYHNMAIPNTNNENPPSILGAVWIMKIK